MRRRGLIWTPDRLVTSINVGLHGVGFGGGEPSFLPTSLADLELWLRADLGITLNGGNVSAWADQSGQANNFQQTVAARQPPLIGADTSLNSRPAIGPFWVDDIAWKGLELVAGGTLNPPWTAFIVFHTDGVHTFNSYVTGAGGASASVYITPDAPTGKTHYVEMPDMTDGVIGPAVRIVAVTQAGAAGTNYLYKNALTAVASQAQSSLPNFLDATRQIGLIISDGRFALDGHIAEVIAYNTTLTAAQMAKVFGYLGARYAVAIGP